MQVSVDVSVAMRVAVYSYTPSFVFLHSLLCIHPLGCVLLSIPSYSYTPSFVYTH